MQRTKQAASTVDGAREDLSSCVCSRSQSASNLIHSIQALKSVVVCCLSVCLSVCLSHPSPSTTTSHDSPALHSPQHPSHLLNSHARFHPPRCLTSLPAYLPTISSTPRHTTARSRHVHTTTTTTINTHHRPHYPLPTRPSVYYCQFVIAERKHHLSHSPTRTGARTTQR